MGHNNTIRNDDGVIENQLWKVTKDKNGNEMIIGGIKVVSNDSAKRVNDLPIESNSAEAYFKADANGEIIQLRVYDKVTHKAIMDIDIGSDHGSDFPAGLAHVQEFKMVNGKPKRLSSKARPMTDEEIAKWGFVLLLAKPDLKFRR